MASEAEPEIGRIVGGKYRLRRLLGRGGMGSVWEGVHTTLGTRFALKYIDAAFAERSDVQTRFANEALAAARLKSKHIVEVYDHGVDERGSPYIVMEYLAGEPLDAKLAREERLGLSATATIVVQVARALQRAHKAGIIHRDLKPENVFMVWDEEDRKHVVKLVDFGIAKFTDGGGIGDATRTGAVLGTPHFMSPEQARGLKGINFAADVWSLGVIAYRCVTGQNPFDGVAVGDLLVKICTLPHPPPSTLVSVPSELDEWMARALAKDPKQRFASIVEQAESLRQIAARADSSFDLASVSLEPSGSAVSPVTAPMLTPPTGGAAAADTASGVERTPPGTGRGARSFWWVPVGLAAAGLGALGFVFTRGEDGPKGSPLTEASAATSAESPDTASDGLPTAEPREANEVPSVTVDPTPDAGGVEREIGRPAGGPLQARPSRPRVPAAGRPRPAPTKPPAADPEDELGY